MDNEKFKTVVQDRMQKTIDTLIAKASEYARGDRLSNFKKIAAFRQKSPEDVLFSLVAKHIAALDDFIQDIDRGQVQSLNRWDEKIGDIIAYMVLLDAMVRERITSEQTVQRRCLKCNGAGFVPSPRMAGSEVCPVCPVCPVCGNKEQRQ